ncbi:MAG: hypothetical protein AAFV38_04845, partial [Pseudomonadota bacterium]
RVILAGIETPKVAKKTSSPAPTKVEAPEVAKDPVKTETQPSNPTTLKVVASNSDQTAAE